MVQEFIQPDYSTQNGSGYPTNIDKAIAVLAEVANNFSPHAAATPDMTVIIEAGKVFTGAVHIAKAQQTTAAFTAPTTNPRIDRIAIDRSTGDYVIIAGTEDVSPVAPDYSSSHFPVCQFQLEPPPSATTQIANSMITDERTLRGGVSFRGALVYHIAPPSIANATYVPLPFNEDSYDTDDIHDKVTNNERLTVPADVKKVRLSGQVVFDSVGTGIRQAHISKNDDVAAPTGVPGLPMYTYEMVGTQYVSTPMYSAVIDVIAGDYFTLTAYQSSGFSLGQAVTLGYQSWFAMEIIG